MLVALLLLLVFTLRTTVVSIFSSIIDENLMWVEKYRPKDLDDVLSHKDIINTIKRLVRERKL